MKELHVKIRAAGLGKAKANIFPALLCRALTREAGMDRTPMTEVPADTRRAYTEVPACPQQVGLS